MPTFVGVTFLSFMLIRLVPGDPIEVRVGEHGIAPERLAELRHRIRPRPAAVEAVPRLRGGVVTGGLGVSVVTQQPVLTEFTTLFPATLELSFCAMLLADAVRPARRRDRRGEARRVFD